MPPRCSARRMGRSGMAGTAAMRIGFVVSTKYQSTTLLGKQSRALRILC